MDVKGDKAMTSRTFNHKGKTWFFAIDYDAPGGEWYVELVDMDEAIPYRLPISEDTSTKFACKDGRFYSNYGAKGVFIHLADALMCDDEQNAKMVVDVMTEGM